ncbi:ornithine carbamoyltransferase [Numidum massiliense]|uniref:ornithine carbamoyltransferase n=1 Tax=Numidum massiliense TaxID=1522315 RepID=UPI0006D5A4BC|nr:ornithine carbamoyltransferase [Numidum massiliense]
MSDSEQSVTKTTAQSLKGRHFLTLLDYSTAQLQGLVSLAAQLKQQHKEGVPYRPLAGKTLAMIFAKASTRTRVSFETGMYQLGGHALFLGQDDIQLGRGETVADTARVLSRYVDGIMVRTFSHSDVVELARCASVPVINALTDRFHPCQALADMMTLMEQFGDVKGRKLAYIGDGNNMAHSLLAGAVKFGMHVAVAAPPGYEPLADIVAECRSIGKETGGTVTITNEPQVAVAGADAVYTDVWASMGQEAETAERLQAFQQFQVGESLLAQATEHAVFMHCLPAHRGEEVTAGVIDGARSVIFEQAENRLHAQKAILASLL